MFRVGQGLQLPTGIRATSGLRYDARCSRSTESRGRSLLSSRALDASSVAIALESQNAPSANTKCANASFREMPKNYWTRSGRDMPFDLVEHAFTCPPLDSVEIRSTFALDVRSAFALDLRSTFALDVRSTRGSSRF